MFAKIYILERKQIVSASVEDVFAFFEDAGNLARITPEWLNFQIKTPTPIIMKSGTEIEYTINWLGFPVRWKTRIAVYDPPNRFIDEQISGPYTTWIHLHTFEPAEQGVLMTDRVTYRLPFGTMGRLAHRLLVRKQLNQIFDYRRDVINKLFNGKQ